ncbi:hypothetical protein Daus18300_003009 [Diaporthe australafricana]|uniref:Uncharacterized protein n=1 Tax=Diaporthe australafricana TaxID=127596 RepID=A0ABR3XJL5_9PEZI
MYESHVGGHLEQLALFALPRDQADQYELSIVDYRAYEGASDSGELSEVDSENLSEWDIEDFGGPTNDSDIVGETRTEEPHRVQPSDYGPLDPATTEIDATIEDGQSQKRRGDEDIVDNNWPPNDDHPARKYTDDQSYLRGWRELGAISFGIKSGRRCRFVDCDRKHVYDIIEGAMSVGERRRNMKYDDKEMRNMEYDNKEEMRSMKHDAGKETSMKYNDEDMKSKSQSSAGKHVKRAGERRKTIE